MATKTLCDYSPTLRARGDQSERWKSIARRARAISLLPGHWLIGRFRGHDGDG